MSDIVERLRNLRARVPAIVTGVFAGDVSVPGSTAEDLYSGLSAAIAEIERLREVNEQLEAGCRLIGADCS